MTKLGKCRLCLNDSVQLRNSHFFPAAAYKIMREHSVREGRLNPNPVVLTDLSAVQTSKQRTASLLCDACEQRLHANGENWVLRYCWRGKSFRLLSLIGSAKPFLTSPEVCAYNAAEISGVNISALTFFAASMFWRAAVHNWTGMNREPAIDLGPYREQLRDYLYGTADFPQHCVLAVTLPVRASEFSKITGHPYPTRTRGLHIYTLPFLGIGFHLFVGRQIPRNWREMDLVRGAGNPIIVCSQFEELFRRDFSVMLRNHTRALAMLDKIEAPTNSARIH